MSSSLEHPPNKPRIAPWKVAVPALVALLLLTLARLLRQPLGTLVSSDAPPVPAEMRCLAAWDRPPIPGAPTHAYLGGAELCEGANVAERAGYSRLWGKGGEAWCPSGRLNDFSFAGYRQGAVPIPSPPVTRSVTEFRKPGDSDTAMFKAAFEWAHARETQPGEWTVLFVPPGSYTLYSRLKITKPRIILRGAGSDKVTLNIPRSLTDIYGSNPATKTGGWVFFGAFIGIEGRPSPRDPLACISAPASRGDTVVWVDDASQITVGSMLDIWWTDIDGGFNTYMHAFPPSLNFTAPEQYKASARMKLATKIVAVDGQRVTIERPLPYAIWPGSTAAGFYQELALLEDVGVEGLHFNFKWEEYYGHHLERGWNAVEFLMVRDSWASDIRTTNADNTVVMTAANQITVKDIQIDVTQPRLNDVHPDQCGDGHWGIHHTRSWDILADGFDFKSRLCHAVGAGSAGCFSVFMRGKMADGNLEVHRALAGPILYTDVHVGEGSRAMECGGPPTSGPNTLGYTTYWSVRSNRPISPARGSSIYRPPGECDFGAHMNLVNVDLKANETALLCDSWLYERDVDAPPNLYLAQLQRRLGRQARPQR